MRLKLLHVNMYPHRCIHRSGGRGGLQTSSSAISKSERSCAFPVALAAGEFLALTLHQLPGSLGSCRWAPEAVRAASQGKEPSFVILGKVSWTPGRARVSFPTLPLVSCLPCEALLATLRRMSEDMCPQENLPPGSPMSCRQSAHQPLSSSVMLGKLPKFSKAHSPHSPHVPICKSGSDTVYFTGYHKELLTFDTAKYQVQNLFSFLPSPRFLPFYFPIFCFQVYVPFGGHVTTVTQKALLDQQGHPYANRDGQCVLPSSAKLHRWQSPRVDYRTSKQSGLRCHSRPGERSG